MLLLRFKNIIILSISWKYLHNFDIVAMEVRFFCNISVQIKIYVC